MNKIALPLYIIGWITIVGGLFLGFSNMNTMVPETDMFGDTTMVEGVSWTTFFIYFFAGLISGIMMFGFAEIVNLLDKSNRTQERIEAQMKHKVKLEKDPIIEKTPVKEDPSKYSSEDYSSLEEELKAIENNNKLSSDMKIAMKHTVKRREGLE